MTDFEDPTVAESDAVRLIAEHAPLGILSLAAILDAEGVSPQIVDLNHLYYQYLRSADRDPAADFCAYVVGQLAHLSADLFGLSSICSSYPLTLRIAEGIKRTHPEAVVLLGGPQASVVDVPTLRAFPAIDLVVRGEAEHTLPALLGALAGDRPFDDIQGITFRRDGEIVRNPNAPVVMDLDQLPLPAFHLYPHIDKCQYVPLELGRGCPFGCTFCSTNDFFRRRFRLKSPRKLIGEMRFIKETYGIRNFDLIHDMFTVDRKRVVAICEALLDVGEEFYWNCSARTDCVDEALIDLMARAGCRGIFFGIETGSPRLQKVIKKKLDLAESARMIRCADQHGITTAVSLITGFPEETMADVRESVAFILDSARFDHAKPQLHLLAPLAETPIESQYRDQLILDDIYSDMSYQGWRQDPIDRRMIGEHPDIFPNFYAVPTPYLDRTYLKELREFVLNGLQWFRWLLVALHQQSGDVLRVFEPWRRWRLGSAAAPSDFDLGRYYASREFREQFLAFVAARYLPTVEGDKRAVAALVDFERAFGALREEETGEQRIALSTRADGVAPLTAEAVPRLARGAVMVELNADYDELIATLRAKGPLDAVPVRPVALVSRGVEGKNPEVIQLSELSARLLRLCDGRRTVRQIGEQFAQVGVDLGGIPAQMACLFGLELLRQEGCVDVAPRLRLEEEPPVGIVDGHAKALQQVVADKAGEAQPERAI